MKSLFAAHCPGTTPILEYAESFDTYKSHEGKAMGSKLTQKPKLPRLKCWKDQIPFLIMTELCLSFVLGANSIDDYQKQCYCFDHCHESMDSTEAGKFKCFPFWLRTTQYS